MSLILVVESEARHAERVRDGLGSDGWQVEVLGSCEEAVAAAAARAPQLVLVNVELPGSADLLRNFSRSRGGPGSIALLPELGGFDPATTGADEALGKPFTEKDLRLLARRLATSARPTRHAEEEVDDQRRLTSQELFGDLLAEVESEEQAARLAAPPPPSAVVPTAGSDQPAARAAAPPPASARSSAGLAIDQKLEETLSGLLKGERPRPAAPAKKAGGVDDLLTRTLSGLDVGKKPTRAPEKPAAPKPGATAPIAPTAPTAPPPKPPIAPPPSPSAPKPPEPPLEIAPSAPAPAPAPPVAPARPPEPPRPVAAAPEPTPTPTRPKSPEASPRRPSRELDLSALDELARPRPRESTPAARQAAKESFATQRVTIPPELTKTRPEEFGQYTLLERIAVGGMAEVWKARMKGVEGFQKTVAIKKILPHLTDSSDFVSMFIDEAKLAAQLNHNNIIHIYDLGKLGDDYFIAMEYVDGKDLRTILNTARAERRPLPMALALLIANRLASALDHAHRKKDFEGRELGLVHRDVSPQNVLISYEGDIKLCDFGIVKAVTKASKTQMGALKGKLQYMSPEQAWGRPVDARSDIFSLGSLLFEMLTGRRLFSGESEISVLDAVREGRITAPRDLDPRLPLEVNALVLKALARDPEDRFESAGEMQREIDGILSSLRPSPTPGDLGEYLRNLFAGEGPGEAAIPAHPAVTPGPGQAVPTPQVAARGSSEPAVPVVAPAAGARLEEAETARGRGALWGAIAAAVVLGIAAYLFFGHGGTATKPEAAPGATTTTEGAPAPVTPEAGAPATAAPALGNAETGKAEAGKAEAGKAEAGRTEAAPGTVTPNVEKLVNDEVRRREEELRKKYEDEIRNRQAELEKLATEKPKSEPPPAAVPAPKPTAPATSTPASTAVPEGSSTTTPPPATTAAAPPTETRVESQPVERRPPPAPVEEPAPAPRAPVVKEGDLVQPGAGVKPPVLVGFNKPEYPPMARRLKVEGTVVLSLLIDETGRVIDTRVEQAVAQNVGINESALAAARSARFEPATKQGVRVKMWYQLRIPFKL